MQWSFNFDCSCGLLGEMKEPKIVNSYKNITVQFMKMHVTTSVGAWTKLFMSVFILSIFWLRGAAVVVWWQAPKLCSRWSSQLGTATWHRRHWHRVHTEPLHRGIQLPQNWRHGHCLSIECGYFLRSKVQQFIWTQISKGTSTIVTEKRMVGCL